MDADNGNDCDGSAFNYVSVSAVAANDEPSARQDVIAEDMWADYVAICHEREYEEELDSDKESGCSGDESRSGNEGSGDDGW